MQTDTFLKQTETQNKCHLSFRMRVHVFAEFGMPLTSSYDLYNIKLAVTRHFIYTVNLYVPTKSPVRAGTQPQNTLPKDILHAFVAKETKRGGIPAHLNVFFLSAPMM